MTYEEKLKAIIEAQVRGGYNRYKPYKNIVGLSNNSFGILRTQCARQTINVLEILLDTNGAKAAYGEEEKEAINYGYTNEYGKEIQSLWPPVYSMNTHAILDAWHSEGGNNYKAAIDTAHSLLPND